MTPYRVDFTGLSPFNLRILIGEVSNPDYRKKYMVFGSSDLIFDPPAFASLYNEFDAFRRHMIVFLLFRR